MQKKNLIIVNTYFQLIAAVTLATNNFKDNTTDLVISDCSVDMENKINFIKDTNIFKNVYFIKCRELIYGNKFKKYFTYLLHRNSFLKNNFINSYYDELLFFNLDALSYALIDELLKNNPSLICAKYDEGFGTYTINKKSSYINNFLRFIFFRKNINHLTSKIYLFHPELLCYNCDYNIEKIPNIDKKNKKLVNQLNTIFDYKNIKFKQKYIFFEESFFCDNKGIDDFDLIKSIIDYVGKENIIIKLHPRNKINRFASLGVETWKNTGIPWEIVQMNEDYANKVFITISSGSILASKLYFNENIKSYFLFNCTEKMSDMVTPEFHKYISKLKTYLNFDSICIPNDFNDFLIKMKEDESK